MFYFITIKTETESGDPTTPEHEHDSQHAEGEELTHTPHNSEPPQLEGSTNPEDDEDHRENTEEKDSSEPIESGLEHDFNKNSSGGEGTNEPNQEEEIEKKPTSRSGSVEETQPTGADEDSSPKKKGKRKKRKSSVAAPSTPAATNTEDIPIEDTVQEPTKEQDTKDEQESQMRKEEEEEEDRLRQEAAAIQQQEIEQNQEKYKQLEIEASELRHQNELKEESIRKLEEELSNIKQWHCEELEMRDRNLTTATDQMRSEIISLTDRSSKAEATANRLEEQLSYLEQTKQHLQDTIRERDDEEGNRRQQMEKDKIQLKEILKGAATEKRVISPDVLETLLKDLGNHMDIDYEGITAEEMKQRRRVGELILMNSDGNHTIPINEITGFTCDLLAEQNPDVLWSQAGSCRRRGDRIGENNILTHYLKQAIKKKNKTMEVKVYRQLAQLHIDCRDYEEAEDWLSRLFRVSEQIGDHDGKIRAATGLGDIQGLLGNYDKASFYLKKAFTMSSQRHDSVYNTIQSNNSSVTSSSKMTLPSVSDIYPSKLPFGGTVHNSNSLKSKSHSL